MKYFFSYLTFAMLITGIYACSPSHDQTIANLKTAIDKETTAAAQYAAFAEQAERDSLYPVEALFKAASQAESIQAKNLQSALSGLGIQDYQPEKELFTVQSTLDNLHTALTFEKDKAENMYPAFATTALQEKAKEAASSFEYACQTGKNRAGIYSYILGNIKSPAVLAAVYYVCPECGNVFLGTTSRQCDVCRTSSGKFIRSSASATLQDATTGASMRRR